MRAYKSEKKVSKNGKLSLENLPFKEGETVEIIILPYENKINVVKKYPLRGKLIKYENPFEPVAQGDWNALK